jgi:outer membrane receptor for ferrienterochelin and colicin
VNFESPDLPDTYQQGAAQKENVRTSAVYLFGQDSWKIRPNLTLKHGLHWESYSQTHQ